MTRFRMSVAQFMAVVFYVGFSFAALRNASDLWASATYTLAFFMISAAPLGAIARRGAARMAWSGFAVFGWARLLVGSLTQMTDNVYGPNTIPPPKLLTGLGFTYLLPYLHGSTPLGFIDYGFGFARTFYSLEIIFFGLVGAVVGQLLAVKDDRANP